MHEIFESSGGECMSSTLFQPFFTIEAPELFEKMGSTNIGDGNGNANGNKNYGDANGNANGSNNKGDINGNKNGNENWGNGNGNANGDWNKGD